MATVSAVPPLTTSTGLATPLVMASTKGSTTAIMGNHHQMFGAHHHMEKQSLQHAILFLQQEHSRTLSGLYTEIKNLQVKCSDMTAQIALQNIGTKSSGRSSPGSNEKSELPQSLKKKFEAEIRSLRKDTEIAQTQLDEKEKKINFLEGQLRGREQRYHEELKALQHKRTELEHELEIKSASIAHLTSQFHKSSKGRHTAAQEAQSPRRTKAASTDAATLNNDNSTGVVRRSSRRQKSSAPAKLLTEATAAVALEKIKPDKCSEERTRLTPVPPVEDKGRMTRGQMSRRSMVPSRGSAASSKPRPPGYEEMIRISQSSSSHPQQETQQLGHKNTHGVLPPISSPSTKK